MSKKKPIALFDLDNTLADFSGAMYRDLLSITDPKNVATEVAYSDSDSDPEWLKNRKSMIKKQPNWWLNLEPIPEGMELLKIAKEIGFKVHICTRGPKTLSDAWAQKVDWCQKHVPDEKLTITFDKSLVYGRVLVDDWPNYTTPWLNVRPRGTVLMPEKFWNSDYKHDRVVKYSLGNMQAAIEALQAQYDRK
jgi:FMN phosphatase YigB (HAD superfamily)